MMSEATRQAFLARIPLFATLDPPELQTLARAARPDWARGGTPILKEGATADCVVVLTSGRAKVVISGLRGQEITLASVEAPAVLGEVAALDGAPRSATVMTLDRTEYLAIPVAPFVALVRGNKRFTEALTLHLAATLRAANEQLRAICTLPADRRVAWCLRRLAAQRGRPDRSAIVLQPKPSHQDIADMTACSRETVSRTMSALKRRKCISVDGDALRIEPAINRLLRDDSWIAPPAV